MACKIIPSNFKIDVPVRFFQYILYLLTLVIFYGIFTSLSVTIVPMTGEEASAQGVTEHIDWRNPDTILSAFFWAYFIPHITGAKISQIVGPKWLLLLSMFIGSVFNIVIPAMADTYGSTGVIVCRVFQGLSQGFIYPALNNLINVWTPQDERSRASTFIYAGSTLGTAVCMPVAGVLAGSQKGWPTVFYVFGTVGILWGIVFAIFSEHSPETHDGITEEEKKYIQKKNTVEETNPKEKTSAPWFSIAKSLPIWAILVAGSAQCWGTYTLQTQIPSYMSNVMNFNLTTDGDLAGLPYFIQLGVSLFVVPLIDKLISTKSTNTTVIRKIFNSLGSFISAISLIALAFVNSSQQNSVVALLVLAVGTSVFAHSGYLINVVDLAPNHALVVLSVVHAFTTIFSILGPLSVGLLGSDKKDPVLWRNVFLIAAAIYIVSGLFYCVFASGEIQEWNFEEDSSAIINIKKFFQKNFSQIRNKLDCSWCCGDKKIGCKCRSISCSSLKSNFDCLSSCCK